MPSSQPVTPRVLDAFPASDVAPEGASAFIIKHWANLNKETYLNALTDLFTLIIERVFLLGKTQVSSIFSKCPIEATAQTRTTVTKGNSISEYQIQ